MRIVPAQLAPEGCVWSRTTRCLVLKAFGLLGSVWDPYSVKTTLYGNFVCSIKSKMSFLIGLDISFVCTWFRTNPLSSWATYPPRSGMVGWAALIDCHSCELGGELSGYNGYLGLEPNFRFVVLFSWWT